MLFSNFFRKYHIWMFLNFYKFSRFFAKIANLWSRRLPRKTTYLLILLHFILSNLFWKFDLEIFYLNIFFKTSLHLTYSSCYIVYIFFFLFYLVKIKYFTILIDSCLNIIVSHQSLNNRQNNTCFNTSCCKCMS